MKRLILCLACALVACTSVIEKPKNLIPEDTMAKIIAELAIADQMSYLNEMGNMETQTIYIFQQHHITGTQFVESYKFYLTEIGVMDAIYREAQEIIIRKDPETKSILKKKQKETLQTPYSTTDTMPHSE